MGKHWLDAPFEGQDETPWIPGPDDHLAGGVVVMSTVVDVPGVVGRQPGLVFRFLDGNNEFMPAVLLLMEDEAMGNVGALVTQAIASAREAAR